MKRKNSGIALAWLMATLLLAACGGGGGGGSTGPVTSTLSFPLLDGYKSFTATGEARNFIVSGDCSGSGSTNTAPATTPATFESVTGFSAATTLIWSLTNCTPALYANTIVEYYDSNYLPLGYDDTAGGGDYAVYLIPVTIPSSVKVGDTGVIGTQTLYTSSLKTTLSGTVIFSYVIQADTVDTAIVNLITKHYDSIGTLTSTTQSKYRMIATGAMTRLSVEIQYSAGSVTHIVLTFN